MRKKKTKKLEEKELEKKDETASAAINDCSTSDKLTEYIKDAAEGLYYVSETDAEITLFAGRTSKTVTPEEILKQTDNSVNSSVEQRDFSDFFSRLTHLTGSGQAREALRNA